MQLRTLACWTVTLTVAVALGPAQATPSGHGTSYWEDAQVVTQALFLSPLGERDATEDCMPIQGTGGRPGLVVYPVLNMFVINQCFIGATSLAMEGPVVLAGGLGHGRDMPDNVTITRDTDGMSWEAVAVQCTPPSGAVNPPVVQAYPVLDLYTLDACTLAPSPDWDSFTVTLHISEALG